MDDKDYPAIELSASRGSGMPPFDPARYMEHVDDLDLSEADKVKFLEALWFIMASFVNLGIGLDSVLPAFNQNASENPPCTLEQSVPSHEFNVAADDYGDGKETE